MGETRKLAAILCMDVVGYSRLAGADEDRILARLRALRSDLIDPTIAVHHGRIVKRTGDGSIVEFRSVVDAVRCAIEVQIAMVERNAGVSEDRRIVFRIGIHLGDVVEESDGDLMGDGVNIAARLEGVAKPGAICLSEDAYRQVKGRLNLAITDLGPTALKNIAEPVRAYSVEVGVPAATKTANAISAAPKRRGRVAVLIAVAAIFLLAVAVGAWRYLEPRQTVAGVSPAVSPPPRLSIVVLPFANLSNDPEQGYFADGITDDLTTDLSHLQDAFVIAHGTALTYKGKPVDVKAIGRELGVHYALEGSVRRAGEAVTINAQLISTETGAQVWADHFDGERSKLGELQVGAVARIANSLDAELIKAEALRGLRERQENPDARDLAMRGQVIMNSAPDKARVKEAQSFFERALALDADNFRALLGLANTLTWLANFYLSDDRDADIVRADAVVDRLLALQPHNSAAHTVKGWHFVSRYQWGQAIAEAQIALAEDPNNAAAYNIAAWPKEFLGRAEEGYADIEKAFLLSPHDPSNVYWQFDICDFDTFLGRWNQAIESCNKTAAMHPSNWAAYKNLAAAHAWLGQIKEAKEAAASMLKFYPGFTIQGFGAIPWSDNPTFNQQFQRMLEGLRKAGVPEGEKKTN